MLDQCHGAKYAKPWRPIGEPGAAECPAADAQGDKDLAGMAGYHAAAPRDDLVLGARQRVRRPIQVIMHSVSCGMHPGSPRDQLARVARARTGMQQRVMQQHTAACLVSPSN